MDWLDLLAVQGTLKSLLQHHNSKTSILPWSAYFIVQLSHPYMTTGKNIAFLVEVGHGRMEIRVISSPCILLSPKCMVSYLTVSWFIKDAITNYCSLTNLTKTDIYFSQFWRLEVQDQEASTVKWGLSSMWQTFLSVFT